MSPNVLNTTFAQSQLALLAQNKASDGGVQLGNQTVTYDLISIAYPRGESLTWFNFTISVTNEDTPACTLVTYSFGSEIQIPEGWAVQCTPSDELVLMGLQSCDVECHVTVPSTPSIQKGTHLIDLRLTANSTFPLGTFHSRLTFPPQN